MTTGSDPVVVNPVGLDPVEIIAIDGTRVLVRNMEAVDGTPILDVKPVV